MEKVSGRRFDRAVLEAQENLKSLFADRRNRPRKAIYFHNQLQVLLENEFYPWVVSDALKDLVEEGSLGKLSMSSRTQNNIIFFHNSALTAAEDRRRLQTRAKTVCSLIDRYAAPTVTRAVWKYLEALVKLDTRTSGHSFLMQESHIIIQIHAAVPLERQYQYLHGEKGLHDRCLI